MAQTGRYNNTGLATMYDIAQQLRSGGNEMAAQVVELQAKTNRFWEVFPMRPCNDNTREKALIRTSLPDVAWRMINRGVTPTKSSMEQVSFTTGGVEATAQIDERLMQLNKNSNTFRLNENYAHQEAMSQKMATTFFYGDEKNNPAGFTGLSAYYYDKAGQDDIYADQIVDAGGTGNKLTSLWVVTFAPDTVYGIVPDGIPGGYQYKDNGRVKVRDDLGREYWGYESQYNWDVGLCVRDPRYVARLANIDTTNTSTTDFIDKLIEVYDCIENPDHGRTVILCNRKVQTMINIIAQKKNNVNLSLEDFGGKRIQHFWGSPILRNDAILNTESQI